MCPSRRDARTNCSLNAFKISASGEGSLLPPPFAVPFLQYSAYRPQEHRHCCTDNEGIPPIEWGLLTGTALAASSLGIRGFRAILHERSKRRVCNASQNAWQRQPNFERRKYTGCPRRKGPNFGRVFLMLNYTDITQNTYIQS